MIKTVLFDLYRTLIDIRTDEFDPAVYEEMARFLLYQNIKLSAGALKEELSGRIERMLKESNERDPEIDIYRIFADLLEQQGAASNGTLARFTATLYRALTIRQFGLFPDVAPTIEKLKRYYKLGLVSDAQWVYTEPELRIAGLNPLFEVIVLSSRYGFKKPDPRLFNEAIKRLRADADTTVYIGDKPDRDLAGARAAGLRCLLFRPESDEYQGMKADAVFDDYRELPEILKAL